MVDFRFGALDSRHRGRLAEILAATGVFSQDEMSVALELFDVTFEQGAGGWDVEEERPQSPTSQLPPPSSSYEFLGLFAEDGTLHGYACYGPTPATDATFDLYWIAIHPAEQGTGEGSRLLCEVERRLGSCGGRLLIAETSSRAAYAPTRRFYDAHGYGEAARVAEFYAAADDRVIYTKRLSGANAAPAARSPSTP
jgi:ribosomal protein S18 acetylase RimI-like enzyme